MNLASDHTPDLAIHDQYEVDASVDDCSSSLIFPPLRAPTRVPAPLQYSSRHPQTVPPPKSNLKSVSVEGKSTDEDSDTDDDRSCRPTHSVRFPHVVLSNLFQGDGGQVGNHHSVNDK